MMALRQSALLGFDNQTRFAVLMHDLGKATTPAEILPGHRGHEDRGKDLVAAFCRRWRVPRAHRELALITTEFHTLVHRAFELRPQTLLKILLRADCLRKPERFQKMLDACLADVRGRTGFEDRDYPQAEYLARLAARLRDADLEALSAQGLEGKALGDAIHDERLRLIKAEMKLAREALGEP